MKKRAYDVLKVLAFSIFVLLLLVCCISCDEKESPYAGKECIVCGNTPSCTVSGPRPSNANERNSEKIIDGIYRMFYCDSCHDGIPVVTIAGDPTW